MSVDEQLKTLINKYVILNNEPYIIQEVQYSLVTLRNILSNKTIEYRYQEEYTNFYFNDMRYYNGFPTSFKLSDILDEIPGEIKLEIL